MKVGKVLDNNDRRHSDHEEVSHVRGVVPASTSPIPILGQSAVLKRQLAALEKFALSDAPVHIYGETGTGKELVARTLHAYSRRAQKRFIAQNCAAVADTLLQSLLFGHRRGAFTGADRDQVGLFEAANGGSLLLDEIGEMSPLLQGALLRVLQNGEFVRLGETEPRKVNVRVISATNKSLEREVAAERFRKDLYFRLVTLRVNLPTLREREGDIRLLAVHFLNAYNTRTGKTITGFDRETLEALERHVWPGNVRELEAEIERACILTPAGARISPSVLSAHLDRDLIEDHGVRVHTSHELLRNGRTLPEILGEIERSLLSHAMEESMGNKTAAARILGVSRQRLTQRLQRWRLENIAANEPPHVVKCSRP